MHKRIPAPDEHLRPPPASPSPDMPGVRILKVSRVPLTPGPYPPPGETIPLSFFDTYWITLPPVQRLFLYPDAALPFASIVDSLKTSLSRTLPLFHPFGGKLTYFPASGDAVIDCSATDGVTFLEAESDLDVRLLTRDETHELGSFLHLVPDLGARELPTAVLAVQVTAFTGGGVVVGLTAHHAVADGQGIWRFVEAWAAACKGGGAPPGPVPSHDRAVIRHRSGKDIARQFMSQLQPARPMVSQQNGAY